MTKLIALVDGSVYLQSVCEHVAWASERLGLPVELLHVIGRRETSSVPVNLSGNITLGARTALLEELTELDEQRAKLAQKRGRMILDDARAVIKQAGVDNVSAKLRIEDILEAAGEVEQDGEILFLGKRGEGADFAKLHLGSNLERIARAIKKPVFVAARAFRPIRRVLIAFDGRSSSLRAVDYVARSPLFKGLDICLLTVGPDTDKHRTSLEDAREMLERAGLQVTAEIIEGHVETVISGEVEARNMDLLVMGAYDRARIPSLILGSTTTEMIRSCKISILLFR